VVGGVEEGAEAVKLRGSHRRGITPLQAELAGSAVISRSLILRSSGQEPADEVGHRCLADSLFETRYLLRLVERLGRRLLDVADVLAGRLLRPLGRHL
jgi:hypothetical protein